MGGQTPSKIQTIVRGYFDGHQESCFGQCVSIPVDSRSDSINHIFKKYQRFPESSS